MSNIHKSMSSIGEPLIEQYKKSTSKYTKAHEIMDSILLIVGILKIIQIAVWDSTFLNYFIFETFSTMFLIVYPMIIILDIKGRLKKEV